MLAKPLIYFRTWAKERGCDCLDQGDLAVWNWIREQQIITVWERGADGKWPADGWGPQTEDTWQHNHFEDGYDANKIRPTPNPKYPNQVKSWKGDDWRGVESHITCYNEVKRGKVEWTDKIQRL